MFLSLNVSLNVKCICTLEWIFYSSSYTASNDYLHCLQFSWQKLALGDKLPTARGIKQKFFQYNLLRMPIKDITPEEKSNLYMVGKKPKESTKISENAPRIRQTAHL